LANRRRTLMIRESLRNHPRPKLLPGEGVISEEEEKKRMQAAQENQNDEDENCDMAFFNCLSSSPCFDCFMEMKEKDVDWTGVSQDTKCETVTDSLAKAGLCASLGTGENRNLFCDAFQACVYFDDTDDDQYEDDDGWMDCSALTECNWPGIHASFVGDGVCHDNYGNSCYNSAICDYDGGDCCEDTCHADPGAYLQCGSDGYACRNPNSTHCAPNLSALCPPSKKGSNNNDKKRPECTSEETLYRLEMFDSFGDGWEDTTITIASKTGGTNPIFTGGLEDGAQGMEYLCLSINPTCYDVKVGGGMWGREASWNIRGFAEGSPSVASGGGSMNCEFSVAGSCTNTCQGQSNVDPSSDADYKAFKDLFQCIDEKCMIQADACRADEACGKCLTQDVPQYCFSMPTFNAVTDCSVCKCIEGYDVDEYCSQKAAPGVPVRPANGGQAIEPAQCTPAQKLDGSAALMEFMSCMHGRKEAIMVQDFDENNFGDLDTFEACAHAFADQDNHGGHTALSCVQILVNTINEEVRPGEPTEAISQLASLLYNEGQTFCDCAKKASDECPLCPSFYNFKTLLYESLDACEALDEIDCDAWDEFQSPCKTNLINRFGSVNLSVQEQCDFMVANCGGAGPFPSFRRLDCRDELSADSWDFYNQYARSCAGADPSPVAPAPDSTPAPVSAPVAPPVPAPTPDVTPKSPTNQPPPTNKKPYVPPEDRGKPSYKSPDEDSKSKSHWFRNLVLIGLACGIAYYIYKRQSEFNFVRYRRIGGGFGFRGGGYNADDDMYSGLALESSTNFEPPTLPPTPMSMPNNGGYGA